jgi:hypothetical protein
MNDEVLRISNSERVETSSVPTGELKSEKVEESFFYIQRQNYHFSYPRIGFTFPWILVKWLQVVPPKDGFVLGWGEFIYFYKFHNDLS